jgi:hypothetical protein|tara:strand:- start:1009 stop:1260 length:252 start_codon:yes stop_codon:yes gene_type:complete
MNRQTLNFIRNKNDMQVLLRMLKSQGNVGLCCGIALDAKKGNWYHAEAWRSGQLEGSKTFIHDTSMCQAACDAIEDLINRGEI